MLHRPWRDFQRIQGTQVGTFDGAGAFVLDPGAQKLFGIVANGSTYTLYAYSTNTLALLGTDVLTGFSGNVSNLTPFGTDGLALTTSNNQIVFLQSMFIPEPSTWVMMATGRWRWPPSAGGGYGSRERDRLAAVQQRILSTPATQWGHLTCPWPLQLGQRTEVGPVVMMRSPEAGLMPATLLPVPDTMPREHLGQSSCSDPLQNMHLRSSIKLCSTPPFCCFAFFATWGILVGDLRTTIMTVESPTLSATSDQSSCFGEDGGCTKFWISRFTNGRATAAGTPPASLASRP